MYSLMYYLTVTTDSDVKRAQPRSQCQSLGIDSSPRHRHCIFTALYVTQPPMYLGSYSGGVLYGMKRMHAQAPPHRGLCDGDTLRISHSLMAEDWPKLGRSLAEDRQWGGSWSLRDRVRLLTGRNKRTRAKNGRNE